MVRRIDAVLREELAVVLQEVGVALPAGVAMQSFDLPQPHHGLQ